MPPTGLVVCLTRCEGVRGFPALFAAALASEGCPWYPEYVVYEEHMPYGQGQFYCQVRVLNEDGDRIQHQHAGVGMTVEQAVQEAAFNGLSVYRGYNEYLDNPISDFYHFPAADEGQEGCFVARYTDPSSEPDPSRRALIEMVRALDLRARQWYLYTVAARDSHRNTLTALEEYVHAGVVSPDLLSPMPMDLPHFMDSPRVGGTIPPQIGRASCRERV